MDLDQDMVMRVFLDEAEELLGTLETTLVALERHPTSEPHLKKAFRAAHTLKGNASVVGLQAIVDLAHAMETVLDAWKRRTLPVIAEHVTLLLECVDLLRAMVTGYVVHGSDEMPPAARLLMDRIGAVVGAHAGQASVGPLEASHDAAAPPPTRTGDPGAPSGRTIRVSVDKLDDLLNLTGEIAISRGRLAELLASRRGDPQALETHREIDRLHAQLQELIMKARLVPIGPTFRQYIRTVRDISAARGKSAELVIEGEDVEVDTMVVEHIRDPLTHLVRNALDHGIESPEVRKAHGKDPCGRIALRARHEANCILVEVCDDGAGLRREHILGRAVAAGLIDPTRELDDDDVHRLILEAGLSTADAVTDLSGRGVGMDVVRRNVEAVRGAIAIQSHPGEGTTFTLRLPLTVTVIDGFSVGVGPETYVLPLESVVECVDLDREATLPSREGGVLNLRGEALPYLRLRGLFRIGGLPDREKIIVVQHEARRAGIAVDSLYGENQAVIKPLGRPFQRIPGIAGATILGTGKVALILDVPSILREALHQHRRVIEHAT
jgi:two-component system chemotaxis sensor kinase CheA